jgi:YD repeat-containing protein
LGRISTLGACSVLVLAATGAVVAQSSTKTYEYDALGRLVEARTSGGANNNEAHEICYDAAGNRIRFRATNDGSSITCPTGSTPTPSPTPTPTPTGGGNSPPTTVNDSVSGPCLWSLTVNLTANDSDPEGNTPLVLQSITKNIGQSSAMVVSNSSVQVDFGPSPGLTSFTYTVADSLGATSTGILYAEAMNCSGGGLDP